MTLRRFLLPDGRWNAPRGPRTVVNLTRPGFDRVAVPTLVAVVALILAPVSGFLVGLGLLGVAVLAGALAGFGVHRRAGPGEAALIADANHLVYVNTASGRLATESLLRRQEDEEYDDGTPMVFDLPWARVVAASVTPTGAAWWRVRRARVHLDLYVTPRVLAAVPGLVPVAVALNPPAADLPGTRVRFTVPRFSEQNAQNAQNMLRWYVPELIVDPADGRSVLLLDRSPTGRPNGTETDVDPPGLRRRPGRVVVIGRLGRFTGSVLARRVGWVVVGLVVAMVLAAMFTFVAVRGFFDPDVVDSDFGVTLTGLLLAAALLVAAWRYGWRLLGLHGAASNFVAITPDEVRLVDADSYAAVPWPVIRLATLHRDGRRRSLCLAVDAEAPADLSWVALRAPGQDQVLPGCVVLRLPLPPGSADAKKIGQALWEAGRVPFDSRSWPDRRNP